MATPDVSIYCCLILYLLKLEGYYLFYFILQTEPLATTPDALSSGIGLINLSATSPTNTTVLSPGEVLKASGKFPKPTKIPGKNYCKDEVVIRNSDSGKGMHILLLILLLFILQEFLKFLKYFISINFNCVERYFQF